MHAATAYQSLSVGSIQSTPGGGSSGEEGGASRARQEGGPVGSRQVEKPVPFKAQVFNLVLEQEVAQGAGVSGPQTLLSLSRL